MIFRKKTVYLTIDDGPTENRRQLVDELSARRIPTLWFCVGQELEKRPEEAIYTIQNGGIIGNHSYSHPHFSRLSMDQCFLELQRTDAIIDRLYKDVGIPRPMKAFRFPWGDKGGSNDYFTNKPYTPQGQQRKDQIQQSLEELGYTQPKFPGITYRYYRQAGLLDDCDWYWTYDVLEWNLHVEKPLFGLTSLEKVLAFMERDAPERWAGLNHKGSEDILLMHDHSATTNVFGTILDHLIKNKKFVFKPIPIA